MQFLVLPVLIINSSARKLSNYNPLTIFPVNKKNNREISTKKCNKKNQKNYKKSKSTGRFKPPDTPKKGITLQKHYLVNAQQDTTDNHPRKQ